MAQHDYVIANASGASVRADINNMALAISSNNSGSSEPSTKYAYLWWLDSSANVLKLRNSANNAWITMPFSIGANNTVDINGGAIDGTNIGASAASTGAFTTLTATGDVTFDTTTFKLDSTNNRVGIGTTSPTSVLNVKTTKTVALSSAADFLTLGLSIDDSTAFDTAGGGGGIAFRSSRNSSGTQTVFAAIDGAKEATSGDSYTGALRFYTNQNSTGVPLERVRITSAGHVTVGSGANIGTSGSISMNVGNTSASGGIQLFAPNNVAHGINFGDAYSTSAVYAGAIEYNHASNYMRFFTASTEKMRIDSSGNLLVGRTSAEGNTTGLALQMNAANKYCSTLHNNGDSTNRYGIQIMAGTYDNSGTNTHVSFGDGNGDGVGTITSSGGTVTYGAFTAHHEVNVPDSDNPSDDSDAYPYGTLVEIVSVYLTDSNKRQSIRYTVQKSQSANSKKVLGAYASNMRPSPMCPTTGTYANNLHNISILGDGHILCNNSGGNIEVGDGICTSAVEGIGMKATTNPSMIVAIAQEAVTFSGSGTKLVAVQFGVQQFTPWS